MDAGANAGILSVLAARESGCEVLAFEPSPRELIRLYRNVQTSGLAGRIAVFPVALSDRCGEWPLFVSEGPNRGLNSLLAGTRRSYPVQVRTARFDALFSPALLERVRVVKVDVEGAEMELLQGMTGTFEHLQRAVFVVEVSPGLLAKAGPP